MKKILFLLLVLLFSTAILSAQNYRDVIYLKNGLIVKGSIIEKVPNEKVIVKKSDDSVVEFKTSEIERYGREELENVKTPGSSTLGHGYRGFAQITLAGKVTDWGYFGLNATTSHGYQFNPLLFVGLGFSNPRNMDVGDFFGDYLMMPLFADVRLDFPDAKRSMFADAKLGYAVGDANGLYFSPSFGVRLSHCSLSIGYELQIADVTSWQISTLKEYHYTETCGSVMFNVTFDWGARKNK